MKIVDNSVFLGDFDGDEEYIGPPSPATLLGPAIRRWLSHYGAMKVVAVVEDPWTKDILVGYELITGEKKKLVIPYSWWTEERYGDMRQLVTKDLRG